MYFLIEIDASSFAEFEGSEFEISRVDCSANFNKFKVFLSKLWEFINLILSLILIFGFFVNTGPVYVELFDDVFHFEKIN